MSQATLSARIARRFVRPAPDLTGAVVARPVPRALLTSPSEKMTVGGAAGTKGRRS